ncbi:MAG TPA: aromatic ring-opening dioxygenase subunit LigA [Pararobbsia sp.]|nr:aromatic ring-opening dioxygenase subunit LigA [Pararobbsia sp.]
MSVYTLQKVIREINRNPEVRQRFMADAAGTIAGLELSDEERAALSARDFASLYRLGVHGLLLRPFSILHGVSEASYLESIRGSDQ